LPQATAERFRELVERARDAMCVATGDGRYVLVNPAFAAMTGYTVEELMAEPFWRLVPADEVVHVSALLEEAFGGARDARYEMTLVRKDGTRFVAEVTGHAVVEDGAPPLLEAIVRDVTERRALETALRDQALHDGLSGLANRTLLLDRLEVALRRVAVGGAEVALVSVDVDDFTHVNDSLGHAAGDELLFDLGGRLESITRDGETVARIGGDEFAILAEGIARSVDVASIVARVESVFGQPFSVGRSGQRVTGSIGVALATAGQTSQDVLRDMDAALRKAKRSGPGAFELCDQRLRDELVRRVKLTDALRAALDGDRGLDVHFQPIVSLVDGRALAVETLVRWQDPQCGAVSPAELVPIAESTGMIGRLGRFVLGRALEELAGWRRRDPSALPLGVFVNVSPLELARPSYVAYVEAALSTAGVAAADLTLELTEETFIDGDDDTTRQTIADLDRLGVRLALDDFGKGYSSLSSLSRFPLETMKIDRAFVSAIVGGNTDPPVIRAMVGLGHSLGLMVVAEGVENTLQLESVRALGCTAAQGYLLGRPMPAEAIAVRFVPDAGNPASAAVPTGRSGSASSWVAPAAPDNEAQRLAALRRYAVLDTRPEASFDELVRLAAELCETPMAFVSLVDAEREFFKAAVGTDLRESPRDISFCGHAINTDGVFVVPDALADPRFEENPNVAGGPNVRFYAGAPLVTPDGYVIGELCVKDTKPRSLEPRQLVGLVTLAHQVIAQLELRRVLSESRGDLAASRLLAQSLNGAEARFDLLVDRIGEGVIAVDLENRIAHANPAALEALGYTLDEVVGRDGHALVHHSRPDGSPYPVSECPVLRQRPRAMARWSGDETFWRKDGTPFEVEYTTIPIIEEAERRGTLLLFREPRPTRTRVNGAAPAAPSQAA
jgi:diguanylate cyclase (GGDEF)-like protein/PAS domain S-box-containing protein